MQRRECLVGAAGALMAAAGVTPALAQAADAQFLFGLGLSINDKPLDRAVSLAAGLGANALRIDAPWSRIEGPDGQLRMLPELDALVDQCRASGVTPLLILAYGHPRYGGDKPTSEAAIRAFSRYASFVVEHFKGRVRLYDLWNEWNTHTGGTRPGSPDDYIQLAMVAGQAVKAVDPGIRLLSGGISDLGLGKGWVERFLDAGGHRFVDGLSVHPYNWFYRARRTPEAAVDLIDELAGQLDAAGATQMPIYITEIGWPNFNGRFGRTDVEVESYLSRFMLLAASRPRVAGVWWYCLRDQGRDPGNKEHRFGLLDADYGRKPIAARYAQLGDMLRKNGRPVAQAGNGSYRVQWKKAGAPAVAWQPDGETAVPLNGLESPGR